MGDYCSSEGADGYTESGTFITWNGVRSNEVIVDYGKSLGVAGFFTFDTSMDSVTEKYKVHKAIAARMAAPTPADSYKCVSNACVAQEGGVSKSVCESICGS